MTARKEKQLEFFGKFLALSLVWEAAGDVRNVIIQIYCYKAVIRGHLVWLNSRTRVKN